MLNTIRDSIARTLTVCAVADAYDNAEQDAQDCELGRETLAALQPFHAGQGQDWMDTVPEGFPPEAHRKANQILADFECRNSHLFESTNHYIVHDLAVIWANEVYDMDAERDDWEHAAKPIDRFGHLLAMQYLGHGVGLTDDTGPDYIVPETGNMDFDGYEFDLIGFLGGETV